MHQRVVLPQAVVSRANTIMVRDTQRELFSTLCYGIWDGDTRTLTYVNAGHEPTQWVPSAGSMIELYATGPMDCRRNDGAFFGEDSIRAGLQAVRGRDSSETVEVLHEAALEFSADHRLRDNLAILVLHVGC